MFFMFFMFFMFSLFNFLNVIGIVAFTISGSEIAIDSGMDVFGVILLGMITSFGGGVIRDITLGIFPYYAGYFSPIHLQKLFRAASFRRDGCRRFCH